MRKGTPRITSVGRTLAMFEAIIADGGASSIAQIARSQGIPVATAHRQAITLVEEGYLTVTGSGRHVAGSKLMDMLNRLDQKQVIVNLSAPLLHKLALRLRCVAQLGTLDEGMVTYRIKTGNHAAAILSQVGMQLEAYCSAIGKVLLAHLPDLEQELYLNDGPFVALTDNTIVEPQVLRDELFAVRTQGFAVDNEEIVDGLRCLAVPLKDQNGVALAAISISRLTNKNRSLDDKTIVNHLENLAAEIKRKMYPLSQ